MVLRHLHKVPTENTTEYHDDGDDDTEDEEYYDSRAIEWQNIIFLPFHPVFKLIALCCAIIKVVIGPIQAVFPTVYCDEHNHELAADLAIFKYAYLYMVDFIYGIDTFFHVLHKQVTDVATTREYIPKSTFLITLDILALIPFFRLFSDDNCPPINLWPNCLGLIESVVVYRIVEYFSLTTTHSCWKIVIGFLLFSTSVINIITWSYILITYPDNNFCRNCTYQLFDWRKNVILRLNETTDPEFISFIYSFSFVCTFSLSTLFGGTHPTNILDFVSACVLMLFGYVVTTFIIFPKAFGEAMLSLRRMCEHLPRMQGIIEETKRKNPNTQAHIDVRNFYSLIWKKRGGITSIPEVITELPRYLRIEIRQDLLWPVYHHSPTFRRSSMSFKRWLCDLVHLDYKLPNENFFAGPHCRTHFYYLRSGIVQLISAEDSTTPLISVTSGTVFGDINFFVPPISKKVIARCLTYCEVFFITRADILKGLHLFPEDRHNILFRVKDRLKHARTLHTCKQHVRGLDRAEDEGVAWVKKRWWELNDAISNWKKSSTKGDVNCDLPPEESVYHCSKYIGRLVLCPDALLKRKSMFASYQFPWILLPNSAFGVVWQRIVMYTVIFVLILHPPNIVKDEKPTYFRLFRAWADLIYITDICVLLMTSIESQGHLVSNFASVMFIRCKNTSFILSLLATVWVEDFIVLIGKPELYSISQFNRLIKIFVLFSDRHTTKEIKRHPFAEVCLKIALVQICFVYVTGYFVFEFSKLIPELTNAYFFGMHRYCEINPQNETCVATDNMFEIATAWTFRFLFTDYAPETLMDLYVAVTVHMIGFMTLMYCRANLIAVIYLKHKDTADYLFFVSNITKHYLEYSIHPNLLKRLYRYLLCHWKFYKGMEVTNPSQLKDEPYDIYWKAHGEIAVNIIKESRAFVGADPTLLKELAFHCKFTILPSGARLVLYGTAIKNVTWLVKGVISTQYHAAAGLSSEVVDRPGKMIGFGSVFFEKQSLLTTMTLTECEILYIGRNEFYHIIKRYPKEWSYIESCKNKFRAAFHDLVKVNMAKNTNYTQAQGLKETEYIEAHLDQKTEARQPKQYFFGKKLAQSAEPPVKTPIKKWNNPESTFMTYWMPVQAVSVFMFIVFTSIQGGCGAEYRRFLYSFTVSCYIVTYVDMVIKCFMGYYDHRGIVIYSPVKCTLNYMTHGFILDLIAAIPWFQLLKRIPKSMIEEDWGLFVNSMSKFARIHLLLGYFNYLADNPTVRVAIIVIIKWQIILVLLMLIASQYLILKCANFHWDEQCFLVNVTKRDSCWLPPYIKFDKFPSTHQQQLLFGESFSLTQCAFMRIFMGLFNISREDFYLGAVLFCLGIIYWCVSCYSLTILTLSFRGSTLFQHAVASLSKFLHAERLEDELIQRSLAHFSYWWKRTKGIAIENLRSKTLSLLFSQDLNYFFFKQTLSTTGLDSILKGGEQIQRELACTGVQYYYLPGWTVMRELDINPWIYIVHRGKVVITQKGKTLAYLTKGSIFGQLDGTIYRPVRVSAHTVDHVDILQIPVKAFQDNIDDEVRANIRSNPQSAIDFIQVKTPFKENPYNTVKYLLRGNKTIQLPLSIHDQNSTRNNTLYNGMSLFLYSTICSLVYKARHFIRSVAVKSSYVLQWMEKPVEAHANAWYNRWLTLVWVVGPLTSATIVLLLGTLPPNLMSDMLWMLLLLDLLHLAHFVSEFYAIQLVVNETRCVNRHVKWKMFKQWGTYMDALSLLIPLLSFPTLNWNYQLARLLRIRLFYDFHKHFCENFKTLAIPFLMNFAVICLVLHALTCGWIAIACRPNTMLQKNSQDDDAVKLQNRSFDFDEWTYPIVRGEGCLRLSKVCLRLPGEHNIHISKHYHQFMVPKSWQDDYVVAMSFVIHHLTHTDMNYITPLTLGQIFYKLIMSFILNLLHIWVASLAIKAIYLKFRELYNYDYNVANLFEYLKHIGLTSSLLECVKEYTNLLWQKQRGNWIPELALQAPLCLREDLLGSLYSYHLETLPLFRSLPPYFTRQLAARLQRVVVFSDCTKSLIKYSEGGILSGKPVVEEGDIFACIYFIHEGEVEKWYTDPSGDKRMLSLLTTNGFFGLIPGLFPDSPHQFTYVTRTVVDMVYLRFRDWQDLLEGYPDVKHDLYTAAKQLKSDLGKT